jgi:hypothetical protein
LLVDRRRRLRSARAGCELDGLDDIVIGAQPEADGLIDLGFARGENENAFMAARAPADVSH